MAKKKWGFAALSLKERKAFVKKLDKALKKEGRRKFGDTYL